MKFFNVYRHNPPIFFKGEWRAHLSLIGEVEAEDLDDALEQAKRLRMAVAPVIGEQ